MSKHPVTIRELKICEREAEKCLEVFAPVQMLLLLTVVFTPLHLILYTELKDSAGLCKLFSQSKV